MNTIKHIKNKQKGLYQITTEISAIDRDDNYNMTTIIWCSQDISAA